MNDINNDFQLEKLRNVFGEHLQENVRLANYTTAHVGGTVEGLLIVHSAPELERITLKLWELETPFRVVGSGANVLVSENGYRGVIVINRAHNVKIDIHTTPPSVFAETGANLSGVSRQVALRGFSGLEWACTVPGTVGGAVYGNAGAFTSDMSKSLILAEILQPTRGIEVWQAEQFAYGYRSSILKRSKDPAVILTARLKLEPGDSVKIQAAMDDFISRRSESQPTGASMGSTFKNPPNDYAGRLLEATGLKGKRSGDAEISTTHANFIINHGSATANDYYALIQLAQKTVINKFNVHLDLEIELLGNWKE